MSFLGLDKDRRRQLLGFALALVLALTASGTLDARDEWYDHYQNALDAIENGDPAGAIELLNTALKRKKKSGYLRTYGNNYVRYVPHFYLGVAYQALGDCDTALERYAESDARGETEPEPELSAQLQRLRSACQWVSEEPAPVEAEPVPATQESSEPPLQVDPAALERGLRTYLNGDLDQAVAQFERMIEQEPRSARLHLLLGMALHNAWSLGGEQDAALLARARESLSRAGRLDPQLVPDPALCPPRVVALYRQLRR